MSSDNVSLGRFDLVGIPPAPRGVPQIEVTFDIDANGIIHVGAKDLGTGKEQSIMITAPTKLNKDEVDKMVKEAERFAEQDKKIKEEIEVKNELDTIIYSAEKSLKEHGDKVSSDERLKIERAVADAKDALKSGDIARIKKAKEDVVAVSHKLAEEIYKAATQKQQQAAGGATQQQEPQSGDAPQQEQSEQQQDQGEKGKDDVIDADFKEEK